MDNSTYTTISYLKSRGTLFLTVFFAFIIAYFTYTLIVKKAEYKKSFALYLSVEMFVETDGHCQKIFCTRKVGRN